MLIIDGTFVLTEIRFASTVSEVEARYSQVHELLSSDNIKCEIVVNNVETSHAYAHGNPPQVG